jgi:hypothetical protein
MMIRQKRLDNFLFCFGLETGGLVFGWLGIIGAILSVLMFISIVVGLSQSFITDDSLVQMGFIVESDEIDQQEKIQVVRNGKLEIIRF